jgi:hypothetical protein
MSAKTQHMLLTMAVGLGAYIFGFGLGLFAPSPDASEGVIVGVGLAVFILASIALARHRADVVETEGRDPAPPRYEWTGQAPITTTPRVDDWAQHFTANWVQEQRRGRRATRQTVGMLRNELAGMMNIAGNAPGNPDGGFIAESHSSGEPADGFDE